MNDYYQSMDAKKLALAVQYANISDIPSSSWVLATEKGNIDNTRLLFFIAGDNLANDKDGAFIDTHRQEWFPVGPWCSRFTFRAVWIKSILAVGDDRPTIEPVEASA